MLTRGSIEVPNTPTRIWICLINENGKIYLGEMNYNVGGCLLIKLIIITFFILSRLYLGQMDCIHAILTNMSFSCSMDQLVNSPVPVSSPMYLQHAGDQCLGKQRILNY